MYFGLLLADFVMFVVVGRMQVLSEGWLFAGFMGAGALFTISFGRRWFNYPCPRCRKPFRRNQRTGKAGRPFQTACANCELIGGTLPGGREA